MKLSIIIVNYNVKYFLEQCLNSLQDALEGIDAEVIVVDNNSTDASLEYLIPKFPSVKFIENKENTGFSRANNQAIRQAKGEYVLLLNPDTVLSETTLVNSLDFLDENPNVGAVGVKMIDGFGNFLPESKRGFPSPWNSFTKMFGLAKLFPHSKFFGGYHMKYLDENGINEVDVLAGAFMLLRKSALDKSGLLDESFFMYGEDIDLSYRIREAGFSNYYLPETIIHYKGESTKKDIKYVKIFYEAMLIFFNKHYPHSNRLFKFMIRGAIIMHAVFAAIDKVFKSLKFFPEQKNGKRVVFNKADLSYKEIIDFMNHNGNKNILFGIYNPETGITISANEVQINKTD